MTKACFYVDPSGTFLNNHFFLSEAYENRIRTSGYAFTALKEELKKQNIDLATQDINPVETSTLVFCLDMPHHFKQVKKQDNQKWILFIYDPPVYCPESWNKANHDQFDCVFTFDKTMVDNKKYFHNYFAIDTEYFPAPLPVSSEAFHSRKLCTMVSSAMQGLRDRTQPDSLLFERYRAIRWFANNHPDDFDFYGLSFEKKDYHFSFRGVGLIKKILPANSFKALARFAQRKILKVYKGSLPALEKTEVVRKYNFYLCYENTSGINGYVTEKLFECLYSSTVPIYWGAPNYKELIPPNCCIDGASFSDFASLYKYIKAMPLEEYQTYIRAANNFLAGPEIGKFTVKSFVGNTIDVLKNKKAL